MLSLYIFHHNLEFLIVVGVKKTILVGTWGGVTSKAGNHNLKIFAEVSLRVESSWIRDWRVQLTVPGFEFLSFSQFSAAGFPGFLHLPSAVRGLGSSNLPTCLHDTHTMHTKGTHTAAQCAHTQPACTRTAHTAPGLDLGTRNVGRARITEKWNAEQEQWQCEILFVKSKPYQLPCGPRLVQKLVQYARNVVRPRPPSVPILIRTSASLAWNRWGKKMEMGIFLFCRDNWYSLLWCREKPKRMPNIKVL